MITGMNMGHPGGPMYGMNNNNSQRRPAPYPNPMYMQSKRLQQPSSFPASGMVSVINAITIPFRESTIIF